MSASHWINVIYGSASILTGIAATINKFKYFVANSNLGDTINEVLLYGSDEQKEQVGLNNLFCIYYMIIHAGQTVDVCVPSLDSDTISKCLINVHEKNHTKLRIIVHDSDDLKNMQAFLDGGAEIKFVKSDVKLEHEFLLVDSNCRDAVAIIGSLDYEVNRVNCNRDATILTSEETLITGLKREFERIWNGNNVQKLNRSEEIVPS